MYYLQTFSSWPLPIQTLDKKEQRRQSLRVWDFQLRSKKEEGRKEERRRRHCFTIIVVFRSRIFLKTKATAEMSLSPMLNKDISINMLLYNHENDSWHHPSRLQNQSNCILWQKRGGEKERERERAGHACLAPLHYLLRTIHKWHLQNVGIFLSPPLVCIWNWFILQGCAKNWVPGCERVQPSYSQSRPAMPGLCLTKESLFMHNTV